MRDFQKPGRSAVFATNGLCATSHPLAAKTAIDILQAGGNAADAAIAGAVLLGLCEPQMTGIGGDCFVLLKPAGEERIVALNGSGRAPRGLAAADLRGRGHATLPLYAPEAVTVPGAIDAFCRLSADWGRLGLPQVLAPAIRYADEGVPVAPAPPATGPRRCRTCPARRATTTCSMARPRRGAGLPRARPGRSAAPRRGAGPCGVLRGRSGRRHGRLAARPGRHPYAGGFRGHGCTWGEPISGQYKGVELVEHPPNGQGATAILMLNILSHFNLAALDPFGAERAHLEAEAANSPMTRATASSPIRPT